MMEKIIKRIMFQVLELNECDVNNETSLRTTQTWDSMRHISLIMALEDEFRCEFTAEEIAEMITFPKIVAIINSRKKG